MAKGKPPMMMKGKAPMMMMGKKGKTNGDNDKDDMKKGGNKMPPKMKGKRY